LPLIARPNAKASEALIPTLRSPPIPFTKTHAPSGITVHVLEHPPGAIPILWKKKTGRGAKSKVLSVSHYKIRTPWIYFLVRMNRANAITDTFLYFARKKAADLREMVYVPPLPNIYPSGHICNGTIRVAFNDPPWLKVGEAFRAFWSTPFTEETWPEDDALVPQCWKNSGNRYFIEYGYLVYIFEYWMHHDSHCPRECFPWGQLTVRRKEDKRVLGTIQTLAHAMEYALSFPEFPRK